MVNIRKARRDDAQAIWDTRVDAIRHQCKGHYSAAIVEAWTSGEMSEPFQDVVERHFFVAELDEQVVGSGLLDVQNAKLDALFVRPEYMASGIGSRMLSFLETMALQAGVRELRLDSTMNAAPFYRRNGFVGDTVGVYQSPRGFSMDCIPMTKLISA